MKKTEEVRITFRYPDKTLVKYTFSLKKEMLEKVEKVFLEMIDQIEKIKRGAGIEAREKARENAKIVMGNLSKDIEYIMFPSKGDDEK